MKIHKILIIITLVLSFYVWLYDSYLYQQTYVKYLPNHEKEVSFPTYSKNSDLKSVENPLFENTPIYGKLMYLSIKWIIIALFLMLFVSTASFIILLIWQNRRIPFVWVLKSTFLYILVFYFVMNTVFFD